MAEDSKPKRILVPQKRPQIEPSQVRIGAPDASTLIDDALEIIALEITKYRQRVNSGKTLDLKEARVLQGYIRSLTELSKEERERDEDDDFSKMQDEQILELFIQKMPPEKLQHLLRLTAQKKAESDE